MGESVGLLSYSPIHRFLLVRLYLLIFRKALKEAWSRVPRQRCIAHKIRNVLERVSEKHQAEVKGALAKIFYAANLEEALATV